MISGAVFDADGTLLDSMPIWYDVGDRYLRSCGVTPPENLWRRYFTMGIDEAATDMKEHFHLPQSVDEVKQGYMDIVGKFYREECVLKPGAAAFLRELNRRGVPIILATANDASMARTALRHNGVLDLFADTISCEDFGTTKREPFIYEEAARRIGSPVAETAVFEDIYMAVRTAHDAGFYTVAMEDGASAEEKPAIQRTADRYITDYSELDLSLFASSL